VPPRRGFRPDVEGLRAVAILGVVLYHARVRALSGGYTGVDVFFVLSGFLITRLLWRELGERGRISFAGFYGRRARRLLPASALVLVSTVVASAYLLPPLEVAGVAKDGLASALYVANYRFAAQSTNYLASTGPPSPLLHYWSLGVEEQFYLIWPALLLAASLAWRGRRARAGERRAPSWGGAVAALSVVAVVSFGLSVWLTGIAEPWAFYSLPTRAWQLAAGGLVALLAPHIHRRLPQGAATLLGWAGAAGIGWSFAELGRSTPYPGFAALAPIGSTVALVAAGCASPRLGPGLVLDLKPLQFIGRISYAWYLWHWPALTLAPHIVGHPLGLGPRLGVAALCGVMAWGTTVVVEAPVRFSPWLAVRPRRSLTLGALLTSAGLAASALSPSALPALAGGGAVSAASLTGRSHDRPRARAAAPRRRPSRSVSSTTTTTVNPAVKHLEGLSGEVRAVVARSVTMQDVPANLDPPLSSASTSEAAPFFDGCFGSFTATSPPPCVYGDPHGPRTAVLFGDSHATMWFPAVDALAKQRGWRLVSLGKATCPPQEISMFSPDLGHPYWECQDWRAAALARIRRMRPALVIVGVDRHYLQSVDHITPFSQAWMRGWILTIKDLRQSGAQVVVMGPAPKPPFDVPDCLSAHLTSAVACTQTVAEAYDLKGDAAERRVIEKAGASYIDVRPWFCTATRCAAMVANLLVYRDDNHITVPFAQWLAPVLGAQLMVTTHGMF
jgi:peptidoglycan/LPS O-acetylase OafA/YrhL